MTDYQSAAFVIYAVASATNMALKALCVPAPWDWIRDCGRTEICLVGRNDTFKLHA